MQVSRDSRPCSQCDRIHAVTNPRSTEAPRPMYAVSAPHAYSPGALLGAWERPAPIPNKLLAGHLVNPGIFFKIANCSTTTQWREYQREQYNRQLQGLHVNPKI